MRFVDDVTEGLSGGEAARVFEDDFEAAIVQIGTFAGDMWC